MKPDHTLRDMAILLFNGILCAVLAAYLLGMMGCATMDKRDPPVVDFPHVGVLPTPP